MNSIKKYTQMRGITKHSGKTGGGSQTTDFLLFHMLYERSSDDSPPRLDIVIETWENRR